MKVVVNLSDTTVGFDRIHPPFKMGTPVDGTKVWHFFPFIFVFTCIPCIHTDESGSISQLLVLI